MSSSLRKTNNSLTPKITHTSTTITKSTPFLIRKHHLDDSEMKKALRHDQTLKMPQNNTIKYEGELLMCQPSRIITNDNGSRHKNTNEQTHCDYYNEPVTHTPGHRSTQNYVDQAPYFKTQRTRTDSLTRQAERMYQQTAVRNRQFDVMARQIKEKQDYGMQEMHSARKKMEKQAKKLRRLYKQQQRLQSHQQVITVSRSRIHTQHVLELEQQVKRLRIQQLELEKEKLAQKLAQSIVDADRKKDKSDSHSRSIYQRGKYVMNKPRYQPGPNKGEDTDSSFSSFQLE